MQFDITKIKGTALAVYHSLFGGRIARTTFAIRVAILIAAMVILAAPFDTILVPSSKTLNDAYLVLFVGMLALCIVGFASAYVKRLHDIGFRGYWALLTLIGVPAAITYGGYAYQHYRYSQDRTADLSGFTQVLSAMALALPLIIALWRGESGNNKFGPAPEAVEHFTSSKFSIVAIAGAALILIPTCIYVGLFQSGVWVGRGDSASSMTLIDSNTGGTRFMKCWNVKGVGAGSGEGSMGGVYRDGYGDTVFNFVVTPDGQIDIVTAGNTDGLSYLADGFRVVPYGMKLPEEGSQYCSVEGLDRFMLVAIFDQGMPGAAINYTTFAFGRNKDTWPEYHVVMTSALSSSSNATYLAKFPEARGKLMIGDCMSG